jgi:hypothetical protein
MTPEQERALIEATRAGLDDALREAFAAMIEAMRKGTPPRDAVSAAMDSFGGDMAEIMKQALAGLIVNASGATAAQAIEAAPISLSVRLYAERTVATEVVQQTVERHTRGFLDARNLALELFEGYGFRDPLAEPLRLKPGNPRLPKYLREALLTDDPMRAELNKLFARIQAKNLQTPALRAAYSELLAALDALEAGKGAALLEKRLQAAFYERMRYFSNRIAQTELHRAYMQREAQILMDDPDVEYVQVRRAPGQQLPCICVLFAGRDLYKLGPGVYPKAEAPLPVFHPFCRCVLAPRLDLTGRKLPQERAPDGGAYFLRKLDPSVSARIMGSKARRDLVLERGATPEEVANTGRNPTYRLQTVGETVARG